MAKRSKTTKPKAPSKNRHTAKRKGAAGGKTVKARTRTPSPRQAALIEDARIGPLDKVADAIGDVRDNMNELRAEEKGHLQVAKKLMHQYGKTVYKHAGVQITLVPGDEKVQVKVLKDDGDASSSGSDDNAGDDEATTVVETVDAGETAEA